MYLHFPSLESKTFFFLLNDEKFQAIKDVEGQEIYPQGSP